jgi:hypothetical protein
MKLTAPFASVLLQRAIADDTGGAMCEWVVATQKGVAVRLQRSLKEPPPFATNEPRAPTGNTMVSGQEYLAIITYTGSATATELEQLMQQYQPKDGCLIARNDTYHGTVKSFTYLFLYVNAAPKVWEAIKLTVPSMFTKHSTVVRSPAARACPSGASPVISNSYFHPMFCIPDRGGAPH